MDSNLSHLGVDVGALPRLPDVFSCMGGRGRGRGGGVGEERGTTVAVPEFHVQIVAFFQAARASVVVVCLLLVLLRCVTSESS